MPRYIIESILLSDSILSSHVLTGRCCVLRQEVGVMIKTGLPAALVKCLYLFVALPPQKESSDPQKNDKEEVKCSFQDTFIQVFTF